MSLELEVFIFRNVQKVDIITVKNVFRRIAQSTKRIKVDYSGSAWIIRMSRAHVLASSTTNDNRTDIATEAVYAEGAIAAQRDECGLSRGLISADVEQGSEQRE